MVGPCASRTVNLAAGGEVTTENGGVEIPPQGPGGPTVKVTVTDCPDIPSDLPHKSNCVRVTTDPELTVPLTLPATVWVCDAPSGTLTEQQERITLHRFDAPSTTAALPHADDQCAPQVGAAGWTVRGFFADLRHGRIKSAGRQLVGMVSPRVLHAAVLDVGAGGFTDAFSDFQMLLSAYMTKCGGDGASAFVGGTVVVKVCVKDVGGEAVEGATVHFAPTNSVSAPSALTNSLGEATVTWTLALGPNSLVASGNGIGGADPNNGPRDGVDPFQPLSTHFDDDEDGALPVPVLVGSETFTATGVTGDPLPIAYGSSGWSYQIDGTPPSDWFSTAASPFASTGAGPFGGNNTVDETDCPLNVAGLATLWPTLNIHVPVCAESLYSRDGDSSEYRHRDRQRLPGVPGWQRYQRWGWARHS